jgi:hypothetical protein
MLVNDPKGPRPSRSTTLEDDDLDVLADGIEKTKQALGGEALQLSSNEIRDVGLRYI